MWLRRGARIAPSATFAFLNRGVSPVRLKYPAVCCRHFELKGGRVHQVFEAHFHVARANDVTHSKVRVWP